MERKYLDKSDMFLHVWQMIAGGKPEPWREFKFHPLRQYRFDFCFQLEMLAIEIDGGQWTKFGGRHARDTDRVKMNLAAELGWRVLHYSPDMLTKDPEGCCKQVQRALEVK